MANEVWIYARV